MKKTIIYVVAGLLTIIGFPAVLLTYYDHRDEIRDWFPSRNTVAETVSEITVVTPQPPATPDPFISSVLSVDEMIEASLAAETISGKDYGLRVAAETAVRRGDYPGAITAGSKTYSRESNSETLTFVVQEATKENAFKYALDAATTIDTYSVRDQQVLEVIYAIRKLGPDPTSFVNDSLYTVPRIVPSSADLLREAQQAKTSEGQDKISAKVAEVAVSRGEYDVAIKAAAAAYHLDDQSEILTYIARCAVEQELFEVAVEAADDIPRPEVHDRVLNEVLASSHAAGYQPFSSPLDAPSSSCQ